MSTLILAVLAFVVGLFLCKMVYVFATAWVLPITQGALFTSTSSVRIGTFLDAVPMNDGELLVDIGCGDGRVLRAARERCGVEALGFEVNLLAYCVARILSFGKNGVEIRRGDFWAESLRDADVIFCYLFPDVMRRVAAKLEAELRPGSRVVSCNFPVPGWNPLGVLRPELSCHNDPIYVYRLPESCPPAKSKSALPSR